MFNVGFIKMMEYTKLEKAVLDWMIDHIDVPHLSDQILVSSPAKREYTGSGSFTTLSVPADSNRIECPSPINGPVIESDGIDLGGAAILFLNESGHLETLEMYANGETFAETITDFELTPWKESNKTMEVTEG
jgi:hypothetical protein